MKTLELNCQAFLKSEKFLSTIILKIFSIGCKYIKKIQNISEILSYLENSIINIW